MKKLMTIIIATARTLAILTLVAGCGTRETESQVNSESGSQREPTNRIDIPAMVRNNLGITFVKVERREVAGTRRVPGAFELRPLARHEYRMSLPGRVELVVDQLQPVRPGDVLYRFSSPRWPELQHEVIQGEQAIESARADIDVASAKLLEARKQLEIMQQRLEALAAAEFKRADLEANAADLEASLPRLEAERRLATTDLANAERTREHALHRASAATGVSEAALAGEIEHDGRMLPAYRTIDWIEVRATEPGVVQTLAVTNGSFVEPPGLVVSTIDPTRIRFRAMGLQSDLPRLSSGAPARIAPPLTPGLGVEDAVDAVLEIGLEADPDHRTVTLFATPDRLPSWIRPGVSAFLEVVVDSSGGPALAIPRSAIVKDGITHVFFRRDPKNANQAIRTEADMGVDDGRWVVINSGLTLGDEIVLDGAYELKLASAQSGTSQLGGHFHADGTFHDGEH